MMLKGIVEDVFGGISVFRGYATLRSLANVSEPKDYQRDFDESRLKELTMFIKDSTFRFFPELILSLKFTDNTAIDKIRNTLERGSATLTDGIKLNKGRAQLHHKTEEAPNAKVLSIRFPQSLHKPLGRLDGNHRLTVIDRILELEATLENESLKQRVGTIIVPFCIVLQTAGTVADKYETAFFHLINAKAKPLSSEENIKSILKRTIFTEHEIKELIGKNGSRIVELLDTDIHTHCSAINHVIKNNYRSIYLALLKLLEGKTFTSVDFVDAMKTIERLYDSSLQLKTCSNKGLFLSLMYFHITDKSENKKVFSFFKDWIKNYELFDIDDIKAESVIKIFKKISERRVYKLFVAMPYWSHSEINEYNKLYKEVCLSISKKARIELELTPIMRFKGRSQRIDQRLLEKIKECDIFVADITENNVNVIFEVGYADAQDKPIILFKNEKDKTPAPFDMDKLQYLPYPDRGYYNDIKSKATNNIAEILRKDFNVEI